jgi:hypothetical protein
MFITCSSVNLITQSPTFLFPPCQLESLIANNENNNNYYNNKNNNNNNNINNNNNNNSKNVV